MTEEQIELYKQLTGELAQHADTILKASTLSPRDKSATVLTALNMMIAQIAHSLGAQAEAVLRCQAEAIGMVYELNVAFIGDKEAELLEERDKSEVH